MKLMLMRHCQAEFGERLDPTRGLTDTGKAQAKMMAKWLARQIEKPDVVIQSNMLRSQKTAKQLAKRLDAPLVTTYKIDPDGSPPSAWREIRKIAQAHSGCKCIIAVSHGPLIENLFAYLVELPSSARIHFAHGAIAYFNTESETMQEAPGDYTYDEEEVKRWVLGSGGASGQNCEACEENADMGWIDMDATFITPDGDDIDDAPAHPNCDCAVENKTRRVRVYESGLREAVTEDGPLAYFHWMVTPNTVARDEDEQDIVTEAALILAEQAIELIDS